MRRVLVDLARRRQALKHIVAMRVFLKSLAQEGAIARLMGNSMLAFFGAPVAHEDDPARAVRAALDMLDEARNFDAELRRERDIELDVRVGINTGTVFTVNTWRQVAPVFDCVEFGSLEVKGRAEPVRTFEVRGSRSETTRAHGVAGLESPMVGRDAELKGLMRLSAAVRAGVGRVAVVIGEPGLGKTRLISPLPVPTICPFR